MQLDCSQQESPFIQRLTFSKFDPGSKQLHIRNRYSLPDETGVVGPPKLCEVLFTPQLSSSFVPIKEHQLVMPESC